MSPVTHSLSQAKTDFSKLVLLLLDLALSFPVSSVARRVCVEILQKHRSKESISENLQPLMALIQDGCLLGKEMLK